MSDIRNHPLRTRISYLRSVHQRVMAGLMSFENNLLKNIVAMDADDQESFGVEEFQNAYEEFKKSGQQLTRLFAQRAGQVSELDPNDVI